MTKEKVCRVLHETDWLVGAANVTVAVIGWVVFYLLFGWANEVAHGGWPSEVIAITAALSVAAIFLWEYLEGPGGPWDVRFHR